MGSGKLSYEYAKNLGATDIYNHDGTAVFKYKTEALAISKRLLKEISHNDANIYANCTVKGTSSPAGPGYEVHFFK